MCIRDSPSVVGVVSPVSETAVVELESAVPAESPSKIENNPSSEAPKKATATRAITRTPRTAILSSRDPPRRTVVEPPEPRRDLLGTSRALREAVGVGECFSPRGVGLKKSGVGADLGVGTGALGTTAGAGTD